MPTDYDIAIVGGGMVGAALATALADTPFRIALIDAAPLTPATDHRLIALTHRSCDILAGLSLWPVLDPDAAAIRTIHVSQKGRFGITRLHARDIGRDTLGHVVPAHSINAALLTRLRLATHISRLQPAKVTALAEDDNQITLTLDTDNQTRAITAKIVIAADGTQSAIRTLLNIPVETFPVRQKALVTITHLQRHHDHIAYERFHRTGALAMLPLTGNRAATIWTDLTATVDTLLAESDDQFVQTLQKQMGYRAGKLLHCDARFSYPLQWLKVRPEHQKIGRTLLIGNAAHTLHPIAAQGLNLALQEVASLGSYFGGLTPDSLTLPETPDYFRRQKTGFGLSRKLTRIFTADFLPVNGLRQLGLVLLDASPPLRRRFLRMAVE